MEHQDKNRIIEKFHLFIKSNSFPCVGAKGALAMDQIRIMVAGHFDCPNDDKEILNFAYRFIKEYRETNHGLHSFVVIFKEPGNIDEENFEKMMWQRLQSLKDLDALQFTYDKRVSSDTSSPSFSFSLMEEAFFIIALHPFSSRMARRFSYPALVFNPHAQFEKLRRTGTYDRMKMEIRKRDTELSGSINPMLSDFGASSEAFQYSGRQHNDEWECPLK